MTTTKRPSTVATKAEMLARIRPLIPGFRERAIAAEEARRLPDESAQELIDAGICRILMPPRFGGYGLGLDTWFDVVREISKADASHGWCASLYIHHPHYIAQFSDEAQCAVWANGPDVPIAASIIPVAQITPVDGGYRVSGQSPFASGIGHGQWAVVGGMLEVEGQPEWTFLLIEPQDYTVADTWFTAGMRATGSNTIVTDNVFVPESRRARLPELREGKGAGGIVNKGAIYRAPLISYAPLTFVTPMLGAAQGAYEHFREWTITRIGRRGNSIAELTSTQVRMAKVAANLDAAELLLRRAAEVPAGPEATVLEIRARSMRDFAHAAEITVEAIDTLLAMSGTAGFATSHPIQRAWRDIHFASMHISINAESNFAHFGRMELGLPRDPHLPYF